MERQREVKKIDDVRTVRDDPLEAMPTVEAGVELGPKDVVLDRIWVAAPDAKYVVNLTAIIG